MAAISIGPVPDLTVNHAMEAFGDHFGGKYEVYRTKIRNRDFILRKNDHTGVGVRLKQEPGETTFVFTGMMPNLMMQALFGGIASYFFLRSTWKQIEAEVADCILTRPEFRPVSHTPTREPIELPLPPPELEPEGTVVAKRSPRRRQRKSKAA
jgi:hypothetical protein